MLREAVALMDVNEAVVNLIMTLYMKGEDAEADSLRQIRWSGFTAAQKGELLQLMAERAEHDGELPFADFKVHAVQRGNFRLPYRIFFGYADCAYQFFLLDSVFL